MKKLSIRDFGDIENIFETLHKNDEYFETLTEEKVIEREKDYEADLNELGFYSLSNFQYDTDYNRCVRYNANLSVVDFLNNIHPILNKWVENVPDEVTNFKYNRLIFSLLESGTLENYIEVEGCRYGVNLENPYTYIDTIKFKNLKEEINRIFEFVECCIDLLNDGFLDKIKKDEMYLMDDYQRLNYAEKNNLLFNEEGKVLPN